MSVMVSVPKCVQGVAFSARREEIRVFRIALGLSIYFEIRALIIGAYDGVTILYVDG